MLSLAIGTIEVPAVSSRRKCPPRVVICIFLYSNSILCHISKCIDIRSISIIKELLEFDVAISIIQSGPHDLITSIILYKDF